MPGRAAAAAERSTRALPVAACFSVAFTAAALFTSQHTVSLIGAALSAVALVLAAGLSTRAHRTVTQAIAEARASERSAEHQRDFVDRVLCVADALVLVTDPTGRVVRINPACERLCGLTREMFGDTPFWELVLPDEDRAEVRDNYARIQELGARPRLENRWVNVRDGTIHTVLWTSATLTDEDGRPEFVVGTGIDVTAQRAAEEELIGATERHRLALRQLPDTAITVHDRELRCVMMEGVPVEQHPELKEQHLGRTPDEYMTPEVAAQLLPAARRALAGEELSVEFTEADGRRVGIRLGPFRGRDGEVEGVIALSRDVTDERRTQRALEVERAFTDAILGQLVGQLMVVDATGRMLSLTGGSLVDQVRAGTGETVRSWHGRVDARRADGMTPLPLEDVPIIRALAGERVDNFTLTRMVDGERRSLVVTASPIMGDDAVLLGAVCTSTDITERVHLEGRLRYTAEHDGLTGLRNRGRMERELSTHLAASRAGAVVLVDVDRFKLVNDTHGHEVGDRVLKATADLLREVVGHEGVVARLGGDELCVLLRDVDRSTAETRAAQMVERARRELCEHASRMPVTLSVGVALIEPDSTRESLMRRADLALYEVKNAGRDDFRIYDADHDTILSRGHLHPRGQGRDPGGRSPTDR